MKKLILFLFSICVGFVITANAQTVTGVITSADDGQPLPGVNVMEKGTNTGTITDLNGKYTIKVSSEESVLVFSFVGFKTVEVTVGSQTTIDLALQVEATGIDEVVIVGYGELKKKLVTGATIQVKGDDIAKLNTMSPLTALQGQTPGVNIIKQNGQPGAGYKVFIRGIGTIGNSQPLYIIDGVPMGNLDYLAPSDIESVDVLKDAASAAIYGSRAANGVILVTTKKGKKGKVSVNYDGYYGVQNFYKMLGTANAMEYATLINESRVNQKLTPFSDAQFAGWVPDWQAIKDGTWNGTNWLEEMSNPNAPTQSHAIGITSGSENSTVAMGISYSNQEGIFGYPVQSNYTRYSFYVNSEFAVAKSKDKTFDVLKFGENFRYQYSEQKGIGTGNQYWNDIFNSINASPFLPLYDSLGEYHYAIPWNTNEANPMGAMDFQRGQNISKNHNVFANVYAEIQPIKGLRFKSSFGVNPSAGTYRAYNPVYSLSQLTFNTYDDINQSGWAGLGWTWENTLTYDFALNDVHRFTVLAGQSSQKWGLGESLSGYNSNMLFNDFEHAYLDNAKVVYNDGRTSVGGNPWGEGGIISYFGRATYNYREKYMATLVMRADASSNFAPDNRWGYFPSVSAGWVMSEEDFMSGLRNTLDFFKLRASWGQNGNQAISPFQYLSTISFSNVNYFFGADKTATDYTHVGSYPDVLPNPDVSWETSEQLDIGFDARLLKSRLGVTFDYYIKNTMDWLVVAPALATNGTGAPYINGGDIQNKGVEFALGWNDKISDLTYTVSANLSYNHNEVTRIANSEGIIHGPGNVLGQGMAEFYRAEVGFPIGYFWGHKTEGVFQNDAEIAAWRAAGNGVISGVQPGDLKFVDKNHDGVIDDNDKEMIGDPNPDFIFGLNINLAYKGFDLSVMTNGVAGNQIAHSWRRWADSPQNNYTTDVFDRWHGEGSSNRYPRLIYGAHPNWQYNSDIFVDNGSYWRISNLTIGYDFENLLKSKSPLAQTRIYLTFQNLYTFTKYIGMDPEIGDAAGTGDSWASGIDIGYYPAPRTVMFGLNLKF
ncbi:MAG: TonB-dependent receptor [Bacteroidales bacterium]